MEYDPLWHSTQEAGVVAPVTRRHSKDRFVSDFTRTFREKFTVYASYAAERLMAVLYGDFARYLNLMETHRILAQL